MSDETKLPTLWVYGPSLTQAMATSADRVARVSAFLRRDHDESREHEFVPAARLDAANLENARLKDREKAARRLLRRIAKLFDHACANAKKCDCYLAMIDAHFAKFPDAALTPKES